jgi:hypothetical protein
MFVSDHLPHINTPRDCICTAVYTTTVPVQYHDTFAMDPARYRPGSFLFIYSAAGQSFPADWYKYVVKKGKPVKGDDSLTILLSEVLENDKKDTASKHVLKWSMHVEKPRKEDPTYHTAGRWTCADVENTSESDTSDVSDVQFFEKLRARSSKTDAPLHYFICAG